MIKALQIKNLATIEDIELDFEEGFSILTGETGAGKSIIINGVRLVTGEKGSAELIRTGTLETTVEAIFHTIQENSSIQEYSLHPEEDLLIQRRIQSGKTTKGYINGTLVPLKKLKEISNSLVDIYGQNDHAFLHYVENQLNYLDHFADVFPLRNEVYSLAKQIRKLDREKRNLEIKNQEREQRLDFLDYQIKEIENAQLQPKEEEELRQERNILKDAEKIRNLLEEALNLSYIQDNSIAPLKWASSAAAAGLNSFSSGNFSTGSPLKTRFGSHPGCSCLIVAAITLATALSKLSS